MVLELVRTELDAFRKSAETGRGEPEPAAEPEAASEPAPQAPASPASSSSASEPRPEGYDRERLFEELRTLYAEALEYPEDVFEDEVQLEAELGVDSVKQVELLSRVSSRYGLPPRESGFRLAPTTPWARSRTLCWSR